MGQKFPNNATSTLASSITNVATSMTVQTGHGTRFGSPSADYPLRITLDDGTNVEVVECTAVSTDTLTISRAKEGIAGAAATAYAFGSGTKVEVRITEEGITPNKIGRIAKTANYTATASDFGNVIEVNSGSSTTQTLLTAAGNTGRWIEYHNVGAGDLVIATTSSQTIDGLAAAHYILKQYQTLRVYSDGSNWQTQEKHRPYGRTVGLTSGPTVTPDYANLSSPFDIFTLTAGQSFTLANPSNLRPGPFCLKIAQDATGGRVITFGTAYVFPGGVDPLLSTGANKVDILSGISDGSSIYCNLLKDFA